MDGEPAGFEAALEGLERAVAALEGGDLGLDEALRRYEEGVRLLGRCKALLDEAERRVAVLVGVDGEGRPEVRAFDGGRGGE